MSLAGPARPPTSPGPAPWRRARAGWWAGRASQAHLISRKLLFAEKYDHGNATFREKSRAPRRACQYDIPAWVPRGPQTHLGGAGSRPEFGIFQNVRYARRFRPPPEIDRRPGRGGYNYAQAGGANSGAPDHRPDLYLTSELILRPGFN